MKNSSYCPDFWDEFGATALRAAVSGGRTLFNGWCAIPSSTTAELMSLQRWDTLTIDLQHGLIDYQSALELIRVIQGQGKPTLARIPWLEPALAMKLLDAGSHGLICPMVSTAEQAHRFVEYCSYPPIGVRSFGPTRAALLSKNYAVAANDEVIKIVQIEERAAVESVEAIAAVPGINMLYVGPGDLSQSYGLPPRLDPDYPIVQKAYKKILTACDKHGVVPGIHCLTPAYAGAMSDLGFRFITISSDLRLLASAAEEMLRQAHTLIGRSHEQVSGVTSAY